MADDKRRRTKGNRTTRGNLTHASTKGATTDHDQPPSTDAAMHADVTPNASTPQVGSTRTPSTAAQGLRNLRMRTGLSARSLAQAAGMPATTYKSYEDRYAKPHLPPQLVTQIAPHMVGRGTPPVTRAELDALAGIIDPSSQSRYLSDTPNARLDRGPWLPASSVSRDVPVLPARTAGWGQLLVMLGDDPIDRVPRPSALAANRSVWALTIADSSLSPRYEIGERVYCDPSRPPAPGGYAVVLAPAGADQVALAHVGRLVGITDTEVTLQTLNPLRDVTIPRSRIATIARVLTLPELLGG